MTYRIFCSTIGRWHGLPAGRRESHGWLGIRVIRMVLTGSLLIVAASAWAADQQVSPLARSYRQPSAFAGSDEVVVVGEPVEFVGYGASADDEIVEYAWDFESDGIPDFVSARTGCTTHRFSTPGRYLCVLTVKDSLGRTTQETRGVIVTAERLEAEARKQMLYQPRTAAANPPDGIRRWYAVMINGGSESRYWRDVELAYDMLTSGYGFSPSDIYLLNYKGQDPTGGNPDGMIDYSATRDNLQTVFDDLASSADADDEVFIWITGHGRGWSGPTYQYYGYLDGRASIDPGDEQDYPESEFKLRSICTYGDYYCNHGLDVWKVCKRYYSGKGYNFYRNKYVSKFNKVYIESEGTKVSDDDIYIERLVDYALGDANQDGYINTDIGEVFDYDGDGNPPYDHVTGQFDEDDWGEINILEDNYNNLNTQVPVDGRPFQLFDEGFQGKLCIDLGYTGGEPVVDGCDEDNAGLFDWMDVNQDGDTNDVVSVDEAICLYADDLYDDELAELVNQLSVAKVSLAALPCFSGGLVEDLSSPSRVICTATTEESVSWGDVFIRGFVAALHGQNEYGTPVDADTNRNGHISMLEAFNYAAGHDPYDEIPQYDDNGDGVSHTDPVPAAGDGRLGCQTYLANVIVGNIDGDADVDFADYSTLASYWRQAHCAGCGGADLTCDAAVDLADLSDFAANWLAGLE